MNDLTKIDGLYCWLTRNETNIENTTDALRDCIGEEDTTYDDESIEPLSELGFPIMRELSAKIDHMGLLVDFAERILSHSDDIDMEQLSSLARDENIGLKESELWDLLREEGYLLADYAPRQEYVDAGLFKLIEQTYSTPYGMKTDMKTLVTGKGQVEIIEKLRKNFK